MMVPKPDFFIVGAPKSGTTSMYEYLKAHPQVFMPDRKEPHFFCPDLYSPRYVATEEEYLALFRPGAGRSRIGEASVYYLYSEVAAQRIRQFRPDARILIMLRNPVEMIHSLHSQRLYSGHEDIEDFEAALAAEDDRRLGHRIPKNPHPIPCLFYRDVGRYAAQVERYFTVYGRDRVKTIIFDDFVADPPRAYREVCRFLEVDDTFRPPFPVFKQNRRIRLKTLRDLLKFSNAVRRAGRFLPTSVRRSVGRFLVELNSVDTPRQPMSPALRHRLCGEFAADVTQLGALLGQDLTGWVTSTAGGMPVPRRVKG
jgi:hypothetical protein